MNQTIPTRLQNKDDSSAAGAAPIASKDPLPSALEVLRAIRRAGERTVHSTNGNSVFYKPGAAKEMWSFPFWMTRDLDGVIERSAAVPDLLEVIRPFAELALGDEIISEPGQVIYVNGGKAITVSDVLAAREAIAKAGG